MRMRDLEVHDQAGLEALHKMLGRVIREHRRRKGTPPQEEDHARLQQAMASIQNIIQLFRAAFFEQAHSVRVKQIISEFDDLAGLIRSSTLDTTPEALRERARNRIKSWSHEARRWVADLPLHQVVRRLPARGGLTPAQRKDELTSFWRYADGARFTPPPRRASALSPGTPKHFQIAEIRFPAGWHLDPLDAEDPATGRLKWAWDSAALLGLLDFAKEALLIEVDGADCGGNTSFARRRGGASLKAALAFSCLQAFEDAVGPKSARQTQSNRLGSRRTKFEEFVGRVYRLALGAEAPRRLKLGPDPVRKAIVIQRAWQRLFKAAGVRDGEAYFSLSPEAQDAAVSRLTPKELARISPAPLHWG